MALLIRALSLNEEPLSQPIQGVFDASGGTIGRADSNTMTLPDPERLISREHARVSFEGGEYWIEDVGGGVSSVLNGKPVGQGNRVRLRVRDELRISAYRLVVDDANEDAYSVLRQRTGPHALPSGNTIGRMAPAPRPGIAPSRSDPFGDLFGDLPSQGNPAAGPMDDLMNPAPPVHRATPDDARPALIRTHADARPRLPDDFDPFGDSPATPVKLAEQRSDPLDLLNASSAKPGTIDDDFDFSGPVGEDALAGFLAGGSSIESRPSTDPLDLVRPGGAGGTAPAPPPYAAPNHTPDLNSGYAPPRAIPDPAMVRPQPRPPAPRPLPPKPARPAGAAPAALPVAAEATPAEFEALWSAFLDGAGLPAHFPQRPTPHVMGVLGSILRQMVDGTLQLIRARSVAKNQLRVDSTIIEARNNNPLKFSPDARSALGQLLQPPQAGFLPAPEAVRDAFDDLQSHQIGTMAGMRAALEGLLANFEPERLESQLVKRGALSSLLATSRKARLWDIYVQHYRSVRDDAEESFHELYGKAFLVAYEKQVERLRRAQAQAQAQVHDRP